MQILKGHRGRLRCLAFSPNGRFLASAAGHGTAVSLWDTQQGKRLGFLSGNHRVNCLAFAPGSGSILASSGMFNGVCLWDTASRQQVAQLPPSGGSLTCIAFSPAGDILAVAAGQGFGYAVSLLGVTARDSRGVLAGKAVQAWTMAFGPDARSLAVGCDRGTDLWDTQTRQVRLRLSQSSPVRALAWSPDGRTLAISARYQVTLWDAATGTPQGVLKGHQKVVNSLMFSSDGRTLASAGNDGIVRLWDTATGKERAAFDWQVGKVYVVTFAPDAMRAAAGGEADIIIWDLDDVG